MHRREIYRIVLDVGDALIIEWGFTSVGGPLGVKFIAVDILLMAGIVVLVWSKIRHSKGERSLLKSMTHAITGRDPVPTRVDRGSRWVSGTTQAAAGRSISGAGRKMRKAVTSRPAAAAATVAAGALTGGAGAGAVAKTMKAARVAAAVSDTRQGNPTVGSSITGGAAVVARRAHDHLAAKVDATKAVHRHHRDASGPARATTGHRHLDSAAKLTGSVQRRLDQVNTAWTAPLIKAEHAATAPLKKAAAPIKKLTHPTPDPAPRRAPRVPKPAAHARATTNPATPLTAVTSPAAISPAARPAATPTPGAVRVTSSSNRPPANKAVARPPVPEPAHPRGGTAPTARPASKTAGERKPTKNQPAPTAATSAAPRSRPTRKPLPSPARGPA